MLSTISNLSIQWRALAGTLRAHAAEGAARAYELASDELDAALRASGDERLSPAQAARESGYSEEHIRRLCRENPELNAGRSGKPAIRGDIYRVHGDAVLAPIVWTGAELAARFLLARPAVRVPGAHDHDGRLRGDDRL